MPESLFSQHKMLVLPMKILSIVNVDNEVKALVDRFYGGNQFAAMMEFSNLREKVALIANNTNKEGRTVDQLSLDILYRYEMRFHDRFFKNHF